VLSHDGFGVCTAAVPNVVVNPVMEVVGRFDPLWLVPMKNTVGAERDSASSLDQFREHAITGEFDYCGMKLVVHLGPSLTILFEESTAFKNPISDRESALKCGQFDRAKSALGSQATRHALQGGADLMRLGYLHERKTAHRVSSFRRVFEQTLRSENAKGGSHRRARHTEILAHGDFLEVSPSLYFSAKHSVAEMNGDGLGSGLDLQKCLYRFR
jgi:hypothetical protein